LLYWRIYERRRTGESVSQFGSMMTLAALLRGLLSSFAIRIIGLGLDPPNGWGKLGIGVGLVRSWRIVDVIFRDCFILFSRMTCDCVITFWLVRQKPGEPLRIQRNGH
jgi:hypothetical protein